MQALEKSNLKRRKRRAKPTCSKVKQRIIASRAARQKAGGELGPTDNALVTNAEVEPDEAVSGRSVKALATGPISDVFYKA